MTRYDRFLKMRARYLRRAKRLRSGGWITQLLPSGHGNPYWRRMTRRYDTQRGELQDRPFFAADQQKLPPTPSPVFGVFTYEVIKPRKGIFPVVRWTGFLRTHLDTHPQDHPEWGVILYHRRRVPKRGRKAVRMNGFQRKCWGAAWIGYSSGYFPMWDPLQRHPNESEMDEFEPYGGPFPPTPPPGGFPS